VYTPWRLSDVDVEFADRENNGIMDFNTEEMKDIISIVSKNLSYESVVESAGMKYD
jgi:hypothetical protein